METQSSDKATNAIINQQTVDSQLSIFVQSIATQHNRLIIALAIKTRTDKAVILCKTKRQGNIAINWPRNSVYMIN